MVIINTVLAVLLGIASLGTLYILVLAFISVFARRPRLILPGQGRMSFAVVVPAHNEEAGIGRTLLALRRMEYPVSKFQIVVVPDNCTDDTAAVVRAAGVRVLERNDSELLGKGYALAYAFDVLLREDHDAIVVVDADTVVAPNLLSAFERRLAAGQRVLQAVYGVNNVDASPLTYLQHVGNAMENRLFCFPKALLGLSVILRGNGMCFMADVLREHPWRAHSVVEDTEYGLSLLQAGEPVTFVPETSVHGEFPASIEQLHTQRVRWASGNGAMLKQHAARLLWRGLRSRDVVLADAGWSLLVSSKPLLMLSVVLPAALAFISHGVASQWFLWCCVLAAGQALYLGLGILVAGVSPGQLKHILHLPLFVGHMISYAALGLAGYRKNVWTRTKRT